VPAPHTFHTKLDAQAWLATVRADLVRGAWLPADHATTFAQYADTWLEHLAPARTTASCSTST
jgi:hypothetical protein